MTKLTHTAELPGLDFNHLRLFRVVAHQGSIAAVGPILRLAQATTSEQLQSLEESLGMPLFVRRGRNRAVTERGHLVLRHADEIFTLGAELLTAARTAPCRRGCG